MTKQACIRNKFVQRFGACGGLSETNLKFEQELRLVERFFDGDNAGIITWVF